MAIRSHVTLRAKAGDVHVCPLGMGTWSLKDDKGVWGWPESADGKGYDQTYSTETVNEAVKVMTSRNKYSNGSRMLTDTGETYGGSDGERFLGKIIASLDDNSCAVATKYNPSAHKQETTMDSMLKAAKDSRERLGVDKIDLYQIHSGNHPDTIEDQAAALASVVDNGVARAVGVSNFSTEEMNRMSEALGEFGVPLASNQVEVSLLRQLPIESGMLKKAEEKEIELIGYSPIAMGRLTGKYSESRQPEGKRSFGNAPWEQIETLLSKLRQVGSNHSSDLEPASVALNWVMANRVVPIAGAKKKEQAEANVRSLGFEMSGEEVEMLREAGSAGKTSHWQHG